MSRFQSRERVGVSRFVLPLFAAAILLGSAPIQGKEPAPASKTAAGPTRKVSGCLLDADGRPIADAAVCLSRESDSDDDCAEPIVLAQTKSRADGCFELTPLDSEFKKVATGESPPVYELWIHKPGLALAHAAVGDEPTVQPLIISLQNDTHFTIRVRNPNGSPRSGATVTPFALHLADDRWVSIPKPIKERLKLQTAADGRVQVPGFDGRGAMLTVDTSDFGVKSLIISGKRTCPWTVTLQYSRQLKGRLVLPQGAHADLSQINTYLSAYHKERNRTRCSTARTGAYWWMAQTPSLSPDGQFTVPNLPSHGTGYLSLWGQTGMPFVVEYPPVSLGTLRCETAGRGAEIVLRFRWAAAAFSPFMLESTFRMETSLPAQLAFVKAVCGACSEFELHLDIPLRKGVAVTRLFRDAFTKRPLEGVLVYIRPIGTARSGKRTLDIASWVAPLSRLPLDSLYLAGAITAVTDSLWDALVPQGDRGGYQKTTADGRIRYGLWPGESYEMFYQLSENFLRARPSRMTVIHVPTGVDRFEPEPIDVASPRTIQGQLADASGKPLGGIRVIASYREHEDDAKQSPAREVSRWTKTDMSGNFRFEGVAAETKVTLVPIRDGVPLAAAVQAVAGEDKPIQFKEETGDLVTLGGRVVGLDHKPNAGAQIIIEVEHSLDPTRTFRTAVDADGTFQTPARFPKQLKYRLTVRSILKDVASTAWICPAAGHSSSAVVHFPDLVADRSQLGLDKRIPGEQVAALVDGRPILASELFERAYPEPLSAEGLSLLTAAKAIKWGRVTESEYRALQETAIKKYAGDYARTRMLSRALEALADQGQKVRIDQAIGKMFEEYVEKLKQDLHASSRSDVDSKLHLQGTSLASLKVEFRHRLLADEYLRQAVPAASKLAWQRLFEYYQAHRDAYGVPAKVSWQLLEVEFDNPSDRLPKSGAQAVAGDATPGTQTTQADFHDGVADRLHVDLGSFGSGSDPGNAAPAAKPKASATDPLIHKNNLEIDVVKYAAELNSRVSRDKARHTIDEALAQLHKGIAFEDVAKKFSTGPNAAKGGWQPRVRPGSLADEKTAAALRQLPEGATSGVIETDYSFRIVRLAGRTPAGCKPFEEVEESIREHFRDELQTKALEEIYSRTAIESPYIEDVSSISHPVAACRSPKAQDDAFAP